MQLPGLLDIELEYRAQEFELDPSQLLHSQGNPRYEGLLFADNLDLPGDIGHINLLEL